MRRDAIVRGIVGLRGFGKSTRLRELVRYEPRVVAWDPRVSPDSPGGQLRFQSGWFDVRTFSQHIRRMRGLPLRCALHSSDPDDFAELLDAVRVTGGNVILAIDEASTLCPRSGRTAVATPELAWVISQGRHERIGVIWTAQRPAQVDQLCFGQTEIVDAFRLRAHSDLEALRGHFDQDELKAIRRLPQFDFYSSEEN